MTTEDDKQLRQLLRSSQQLPEPDWNLFARTSKRWSRVRQAPIEIQQVKKETAVPIKKKDVKKSNDTSFLKSIRKVMKEKTAFKKDITKTERRVARMREGNDKEKAK